MSDFLTIIFAEQFSPDLSGQSVAVLYTLKVKFTTPDKNGEDYERAEIELLPESFERYLSGLKDPFAVLKPESEIPHFYAKVRELARAEYVSKRMEIQ